MIRVKRREKENAASLIRRFTRKVQQSGVLVLARKLRFKEKSKSKRKKREDAIRRTEIRTFKEKLRKLGKLEDEQISYAKIKKLGSVK